MSDWGNEYPTVIDLIRQHLDAVLAPVGCALILGAVPDGKDSPRTTRGQLRPFVVLEFSSPADDVDDWGITGVADQMGMFGGTALCISETYISTVRLVGVVANALRGFRPTEGCTEIEIFGGVVRAPVDALMHPSRFAQTVGFGLSIGAIVVP